MSSKQKWYVVWAGFKPGIYTTWPECQKQVHGYAGARYKSFKTQKQAQEAYQAYQNSPQQQKPTPTTKKQAKSKLPSPSTNLFATDSSNSSSHQSCDDQLRPHQTALDQGNWVIYSDGGSDPNPGPGGYGVVVLKSQQPSPENKDRDHVIRQEFYGGFEWTTNNRMELMGWIVGLEKTPLHAKVRIYSDSKYVGDMYAKGYAHAWRNKAWKTASKKPVANIDLWEKLLDLTDQRDVDFVHVYGHTGIAENERCDQLVHLARAGELSIDHGYDK